MAKTHEIVSMEAATTKNSNSKMWRCTTATGERVNVFSHTDPAKDSFHLFAEAGYSELLLLASGESWTWNEFPIGVELVKNGDWLNVVAVEPKPDGAQPDARYKPNLALYRQMACEWAKSMLSPAGDVCLWDIETTGTRWNDEIVSISILALSTGEIVNHLVCPSNPERMDLPIWGNGLTPAAKTGITSAMLEDAPPFSHIWPEIFEMLAGRIWVTYNTGFDVPKLHYTCQKHNLPLIPSLGVNCAMKMYAAYNGEWNEAKQDFAWKKLEDACEALGLPILESHRANEDVRMLHAVLKAMAAQA